MLDHLPHWTITLDRLGCYDVLCRSRVGGLKVRVSRSLGFILAGLIPYTKSGEQQRLALHHFLKVEIQTGKLHLSGLDL